MLKTELNYNPYMLETSVKFNGKSPRINSLVEKYQDGRLQDWIMKIPEIFYNEMNGYDFELEFSGTKLDYEELCQAFVAAGVLREEVRLFHKNELDEREQKEEQIKALKSWMEEHPNRRFDMKAFKQDNSSLFDNSYTYIIFQGDPEEQIQITWTDVSAEQIEEMSELADADLNLVPIVFCISRRNYLEFQKHIDAMIKRKDITEEQLFFLVEQGLEQNEIQRLIQDLGIKNPQMVDGYEDCKIKKYMDFYPVAQFIYDAIQIFEAQFQKLEAELERENKESAIINEGIYIQIEDLEDKLKNLKEGLDRFLNRDNLSMDERWQNTETVLLHKLIQWKKKKIKIVNEVDAYIAAQELQEEIEKDMKQFFVDLEEAVVQSKQELEDLYASYYQNASTQHFAIEKEEIRIEQLPEIPYIKDDVLKLRDEEMVAAKEDIFNKFFNMNVGNTEKETVLKKTYYYQKWREYAGTVVIPIESNLIKEYFQLFQEYEQRLAQRYIQRLQQEISDMQKEKEKVSSQLSEDQRLLQDDNDWLKEVQGQLHWIERG